MLELSISLPVSIAGGLFACALLAKGDQLSMQCLPIAFRALNVSLSVGRAWGCSRNQLKEATSEACEFMVDEGYAYANSPHL